MQSTELGASGKPLNVVIIGGSLAGLMCGVALKNTGHTVTILEREGNERQSHMAGVCLGADVDAFLARNDRIDSVFYHSSFRVQALKADNSVQVLSNVRRDLTSWDSYYFRLRADFDGYTSSYYLKAPKSLEKDGWASYEPRKEVLDIQREGGADSKIVLSVLDRNTQEKAQVKADLVIGADGPDSFVRSRYLPGTQRQYVGYIAWRGTVPEHEVSDSARELFKRSATVSLMGRHHCIVYSIPGPDGTLKDGERLINFLWYTNETPGALNEILVDGVDGHHHHNIVPAGRVREDIWNAQLERAKREFSAPFLEVVTKIQRPFVQVITDFCSPRAAFEDGRVLLMGDALALFRPHTAASSTQAAFHALSIEEYASGKLSLQDWEDKVLRYSYLHWAQSIWWGKFYQDSMTGALMSGLHYYMHVGIDRMKSWWRGEESLLRPTSVAVDEHA